MPKHYVIFNCSEKCDLLIQEFYDILTEHLGEYRYVILSYLRQISSAYIGIKKLFTTKILGNLL